MIAALLSLAVCLGSSLEVRDPRLHVALAAITVAVLAPSEASALYKLARIESRWTPAARSEAGACGVWQQIPRYARWATSCGALQRQPIHAALTAISTWRTMRRLCGEGAIVCYQYGPNHPRAVRTRGGGGRRW